MSRGAAYTLVLCNTDEDHRREAKVLESLDGRIDACCWNPSQSTARRSKDCARWASIVLIDRRVGPPMGFDCVPVDNYGGARRAIG